MKNKSFYINVLIFIVFALSGCKKEEVILQVPKVITFPVTDIAYQSATCGGSVVCEGTSITACGICWSTSATPTLADSITQDGNEAGSFTSTMKSLKPDLTYYVRAYATNDIGTTYGSIMKFKTKRASISVITTQANTILHNSAVSGGTVSTSTGITLVTRGVCWSLSPYPTIEDYNTTATSTANIYDVTLSNLQPNTLYYVRAYASSYNELIYGDNITFKTRQTVLSVSAPTLSNITATTVDYSGTVTSEQPTLITSRGVCWSTSSIPTTEDNKTSNGIGDGTFTASITGLKASTTYYVRTYVTDNEGTVYGDIVMFKTNDAPIVGTPTVSTISVTRPSSAVKIQGQILNEGNSAVTQYGFCCSTSPNPTLSNSIETGYNTGTTTTFTIMSYSIRPAGTTYYFRTYASNSYGTGYGNVIAYIY